MGNTPAFQFYPRQWLGDDKVIMMDWDARGMHLHLMCIAWQQDPPCTLPDDDDALRRLVGSPDDWDRLKPQIMAAWKKNGKRWVQAGLLREYVKQAESRKKRQAAAERRWSTERDKADKQSICNADAKLCSSTSTSTSTSSSTEVSKNKRTQPKKFTPPSVAEVRTHTTDRKYTFDPEAFVAHYTANGWRVGRNPMKSWEAACTTWQKREPAGKQQAPTTTPWHPDDVTRYGQPGSEHARWFAYMDAHEEAAEWPRFDDWLEGK